jgi:DNA-binding transcriptional LysR family regulator
MLNETALRRADLNLLLLFHIVLRERHVGRAASALHISPSAVSHGLGRLRRLFGDPLFLKMPKGVVPTARSLSLAEPIADLLVRAGQLVAGPELFTPLTSNRSFTIGSLDAVATSFLPALLSRLRRLAPQVQIHLKHVAIEEGPAELDSRRSDVVVLPVTGAIPARFVARPMYQEEFVVVARTGHPFLRTPTLRHYCQLSHLLVAPAGGIRGFVDDLLAAKGLHRQIALTVPNFLLGMAVLAQCDLIGTMPRQIVTLHAKRFKLQMRPPPLPLPVAHATISAMVPKVALGDEGLSWLFGLMGARENQTDAKRVRR